MKKLITAFISYPGLLHREKQRTKPRASLQSQFTPRQARQKTQWFLTLQTFLVY
jgi:hypothetical protein